MNDNCDSNLVQVEAVCQWLLQYVLPATPATNSSCSFIRHFTQQHCVMRVSTLLSHVENILGRYASAQPVTCRNTNDVDVCKPAGDRPDILRPMIVADSNIKCIASSTTPTSNVIAARITATSLELRTLEDLYSTFDIYLW